LRIGVRICAVRRGLARGLCQDVSKEADTPLTDFSRSGAHVPFDAALVDLEAAAVELLENA
jgi:hypothetical protein